ncbi:MATE family efflux transporter [Jannaschia sp.]|nr:MATE family efflux transporter [Jannaschia sp.]
MSESALTAPVRTVLGLAWPMTVKAMILHGTIVIDAYLVAGLGEASLAAMGIAAAVAGVVLGSIFAFASALQIRTAQAFGTKDAVFLKSVLVCGLIVSAAVGMLGLGVIAVAEGPLIGALAPTPEIAGMARAYLSIFAFVILFEIVGQVLSSFFNGCGQTRVPLYSYCLSLPINVASSIVLIHGLLGFPALGVAGAALGSAIAAGVQISFLAWRLWLRHGAMRSLLGWHGGSLRAALRRHVSFVLPIAATFFSAMLAGHVCTLIYARLSLEAFAAMTLITPWIMVAGTIGMQWAQASGIVVAQLLGQGCAADDLDRFLSATWRASFIAAAFVAAIYGAVCLSANALYADLSTETRMILLGFAPILLLLPFPKESNAICGNTLRASGDTMYVMHIFVWTQWLFRVPATAVAVLLLQLPAFWVLSILLLEELLKFPAFHARLRRGLWKSATVAS